MFYFVSSLSTIDGSSNMMIVLFLLIYNEFEVLLVA